MFLSPLKVYLCPYTHIQHIHVSTCLSAQQQSTCPETGIKESATKFHTHTLIFTYEFCGEVDQRDEKENYTTRCAPLSFYLVSLYLSHRSVPDPVGGPSVCVFVCPPVAGCVFLRVCDAANAISGKFAHAAFAPMKKSPQNGTRDSTPLGWQFTRTSSRGQNTRAF